MQHLGEGPSRSRRSAPVGSRPVDRTPRVVTIEREQEQTHDVVDVNPAQPLLALAQAERPASSPAHRRGPPGQPLEDRRHHLERALALLQHDPGPDRRQSDAQGLGGPGGVLQLAADDREEVGPRRALLGGRVVADHPVIADCRALDEDVAGLVLAFLIAATMWSAARTRLSRIWALRAAFHRPPKTFCPARLTTASHPSTASCQAPDWPGSPWMTVSPRQLGSRLASSDRRVRITG